MSETTQVSLSSIPTWNDYFVSNLQRPILQVSARPSNSILNGKVSLWNGNITWLKLDAIVNATNTYLAMNPWGSVGRDIHNAAGPQMRTYQKKFICCEPGKANITPGFDLFANYVIHTTSPTNGDAKNLAECYRNSLNLLVAKGLRTIAFPCIATGVCRRGYTRAEAAEIAIRETWNFLLMNHHKVDRIVFCTFLPENKIIYESLMQSYFPVRAII